ncbi:hypothetical protein RhiirA4_515508 [Rhizophagus irregularis]|uniref:Uncharacterized protein n=1 Tax=Rhizophagus irregularis TaxID=588596 RepID=A0A2I1HKZ9_9GLOM|nr:hypothetical protein RhiirA4_515508 [Rhizophagus irregularis]
MTEAEDNIMDNSISNYKEEMDLKDQESKNLNQPLKQKLTIKNNYHFSDFNIKGYPLGYNWPQRDRAISKLKKLQFDKSNHTPDKSTQPQLVGSHETATKHDDDSKEKVNNKPHIQGQHITLGRHTHRNQRFKNNHNSKNHNITKKNLDNIPSCTSGSNKTR